MDCVCARLYPEFIETLTTYSTFEYVKGDQSKITDSHWLRTTEASPGLGFDKYWNDFKEDGLYWRRETANCVTLYNIEKFIPGEDFVEDNSMNQPKRYEGEHKLLWKHCRVGSKDGELVDMDIRKNTYQVKAKPRFYLRGGVEDSLKKVISKLYPPEYKMKRKESKKLLIPYITRNDKNSNRYYIDSGSDSDYDSDYVSDYERPEYKSQPFSDDFSLLAYTKGGFFKEHSDTRKGLVFATTLILCPSKMTGGDLVLRIPSERVYDPDNQLVVDGDFVKLEVSKLIAPVLISFRTSVPHEVKEVTSGFRICLKTSQYLPVISSYFDNVIPYTGEINVGKTMADIRMCKYENRLEELKAKRDKLEEQIQTLLDKMGSLEDQIQLSDYELVSDDEEEKLKCETPISSIKSNTIVIMTTGPKDYNQSTAINSEFLIHFKENEVKYISEILKKHPLSTIRILRADRPRISYDRGFYYRGEVEDLCSGTGTGYLRTYSLPKKVDVCYFEDPEKVSVGYKIYTNTVYNDDTYCGMDEVMVYALCIQCEKFI